MADPALARTVPETFKQGIARAEAAEAEAEASRAAEITAAEQAVEARFAATVAELEQRLAEASEQLAASGEPPSAAAAGTGAGSPDVDGAIDWSAVPATTVTLFYPGQASFEWVLNGRDHGGARAFTKAGDRCSTCHAKEAKSMGEVMVSGEKAEATPIPGKRPHIDLAVQAAYDEADLYLRFQWPRHAPRAGAVHRRRQARSGQPGQGRHDDCRLVGRIRAPRPAAG